ncbi:MAG: hypothetical protein ACYTF1_14510 [Planctomycetota bacterium]
MKEGLDYRSTETEGRECRWILRWRKIWYNITMKVLRDKTRLIKMSKIDDPFVAESPQECISFMWELTAEMWSLSGMSDVERRLQRNVTKLIRIKKPQAGKKIN